MFLSGRAELLCRRGTERKCRRLVQSRRVTAAATLKKVISNMLLTSKAPGQRTVTPVCADAKEAFPILNFFRGHATGETFGFTPISTA